MTGAHENKTPIQRQVVSGYAISGRRLLLEMSSSLSSVVLPHVRISLSKDYITERCATDYGTEKLPIFRSLEPFARRPNCAYRITDLTSARRRKTGMLITSLHFLLRVVRVLISGPFNRRKVLDVLMDSGLTFKREEVPRGRYVAMPIPLGIRPLIGEVLRIPSSFFFLSISRYNIVVL